MNRPSDDTWDQLRAQIIGLGEHSARKSYYPELQQHIRELEETRGTLAATNRQLQAVLDAASEVAIIATDRDGLITLFNHGAEKMLGYQAEEMVGKLTPISFHLESEIEGRARTLSTELGRPITGFRTFVENARHYGVDHHEWTYVRKDGGMLLVNLIVTAIHDEHGAIKGFLGIAEDITRQKAMEYQLIENEKLLGSIIDTIPNPIFYKNAEGVYTGCNEAFCSYLGRPREQVIGSTVFDLATPELAGVYHQADLEVMNGGENQTYESSVLYADGSMHDVIFYKSCMHDEQGEVRGLVGVMLDITDRKRIERELLQKEELFHLLFEKSGDANLLIDNNSFIDCNEATLRMLGYSSKQQVINCHPADLSPEYQPDGSLSSHKANDMIRQAFESGSVRFEWLHRRADGSNLPVEVMLTAIPMNDRWIIHTAWRDLTEHKLAEAEKERLIQSLLHSQKIESIGRLAGGVAHDFNNLLTPIIGYAEMLHKFCSGDERATKRLHGLLEAACKARDLTRQLLAFGRKQMLEMKVIDLNQVIGNFTTILERTIREDIHIALRLAPDLWCITADPSQIEQIIMNLAINAQDAMPAGGTLLIETENCLMKQENSPGQELPPGPYVKLVASDTGCGMSAETQEKIFEPFFTTKELGKGTGLGLSTVFGIVKQHGGHINVYSEPGHGSTFTLYLPGLADSGQVAELEHPGPGSCAQSLHATILLTEDNRMVREMTGELLAGLGYTVLQAEGPLQALEIMKMHRGEVNLLLSDVVMPEMSGPLLYDQLRELKPNLKALFMSGYSENIITHNTIMADTPNYIQKPFTSHDLHAKIQEVLARG